MHTFTLSLDQTEWWNEQSTRLPFWEVQGFDARGFEPWSSQTVDINIDTYRFLGKCLALLVYGKNQLDDMTEGDIRSWCWWPVVPVGQHHKVAMSVDTHPDMTFDVAGT